MKAVIQLSQVCECQPLMPIKSQPDSGWVLTWLQTACSAT